MFTANLLSFSLKDSFPIDFTYHLLFTKVDILYVIIPLNYNAGVARKYYLFIFIFLVVTIDSFSIKYFMNRCHWN